LVVRQDKTERLIPFVGAYVLEVDLPGKTIRVDWGLDY
jgi:16S rRNA processing protein RimM